MSVTVHVTRFVPAAKSEGALLVTEATAQLSLVTGVPKATLVAPQPEFADTVTSARQVMVGLVVSRTITRCRQVLVFPLVSVTVHVTRFVPALNKAGALLFTEATAQLSAVAGVPSATFVALQPELADTVTSVGQVIVGFVVSRTMTRWRQVLELPLVSVTVHVTRFVPAANSDGALLFTEATAQLSAVAGVPSATLAAPQPELADTVTSAGQVRVGLVVSGTMTRWTQVLELPLVSVTVHLTRFVPAAKSDGALLVSEATAQLSLVAGVPNATLVAPQPELADTVTSAGQVISGSSVSLMVTVKVQVLLLPLASSAMFVTVVTPSGNVLPLDGTEVRLVTLQLSVAVTTKVTLLRLHCPAFALNTRLLEQVIPGGVLSMTVTV